MHGGRIDGLYPPRRLRLCGLHRNGRAAASVTRHAERTPARTLLRDAVLRLTGRHTWARCSQAAAEPPAGGRGHGELPDTDLGTAVHHRR
jgi:hypothetical protein